LQPLLRFDKIRADKYIWVGQQFGFGLGQLESDLPKPLLAFFFDLKFTDSGGRLGSSGFMEQEPADRPTRKPNAGVSQQALAKNKLYQKPPLDQLIPDVESVLIYCRGRFGFLSLPC
jgi:hypothetical protein